MTSPFMGEFCEVRELQKREREARDGKEGRGTPAGMQDVFLRRNSSGMALVHFSPQAGCSASASSNKLADCTVQWADVAHIQLIG